MTASAMTIQWILSRQDPINTSTGSPKDAAIELAAVPTDHQRGHQVLGEWQHDHKDQRECRGHPR